MGKGSNTTQQQSSTSATPQAEQAYSNLLTQAQGTAATPYQAYTGELVAPFNQEQNMGVAGVNNYANAAQPAIGYATNQAINSSAPLSQAAVQQYMSPYTQNVVNATQNQFNNQNAIQQQGVVGNAIAQNALGGNREAIAQAETANQEQLAQAPVIAGLENTGYNNAVNTAEQQQGIGLSGASTIGNLGVSGQTAGLTGAGTQLATGTQQQQTQQALDQALLQQYQQQQAYPFQTEQWLAGMDTGLGNAMGSSTSGSTTAPAPSLLGQILGGITSGAGIIGGTGGFGSNGWLSQAGSSVGSGLSSAASGAGDALASLFALQRGGVVPYAKGGEVKAPKTFRDHLSEWAEEQGIPASLIEGIAPRRAMGGPVHLAGGGIASPYSGGTPSSSVMGVAGTPWATAPTWVPTGMKPSGTPQHTSGPTPAQIPQNDMAKQASSLGSLANSIVKGVNGQPDANNPNAVAGGQTVQLDNGNTYNPNTNSYSGANPWAGVNGDGNWVPQDSARGGAIGFARGGIAGYADGGTPQDEYSDLPPDVAQQMRAFSQQMQDPNFARQQALINQDSRAMPVPQSRSPYGGVIHADGTVSGMKRGGIAGYDDGGDVAPSFDDRFAPADDAPLGVLPPDKAEKLLTSTGSDMAVINPNDPVRLDPSGPVQGNPANMPRSIKSNAPSVVVNDVQDDGTAKGVASSDDVPNYVKYGSKTKPDSTPSEALAYSGDGIAPESVRAKNETDASKYPANAGVAPSKSTDWGSSNNLWPALMSAGFGMMASRSPFWANAVGEGGMAGMNTYAAEVKAQQEAQQHADQLALEHERLSGTQMNQTVIKGPDGKPMLNPVIAENKEAEKVPFGWQENDDGSVTAIKGGPADPAYLKSAADARAKVPFGWHQQEDGSIVPIPGGPADTNYIRSKTDATTKESWAPAGWLTTKDGAIHPISQDRASGKLKDNITGEIPTADDKITPRGAPKGASLSDYDAQAIASYMVATGDDSRVKSLGFNPENKALVQKYINQEMRDKKVTNEELAARRQDFAANGISKNAAARTRAVREENLNIILKVTSAAIPTALEESAKVQRYTGIVPFDRIIQNGEVITNDADLVKFGMANLQLAENWARAMNPTGVMRESDRDKALHFLDTAFSQKTYEQAVLQLQKQITLERDAIKKGEATPASAGVPQNPGSEGAAASAPLTPKDQEALDWANKNPDDPKAAAIKQHFKIQ